MARLLENDGKLHFSHPNIWKYPDNFTECKALTSTIMSKMLLKW